MSYRNISQKPAESFRVNGGLMITSTSGEKSIAMGNQNGAGENHPGMIKCSNGVLRFGSGSSWDHYSGGTFKENFTVNDNNIYSYRTINCRVDTTVAPIKSDSKVLCNNLNAELWHGLAVPSNDGKIYAIQNGTLIDITDKLIKEESMQLTDNQSNMGGV